MMINPEKIDLLKSIEDYKDSISKDLERLEKLFNRSCCDDAEYETLLNVESCLSIIINNYINQEYPSSGAKLD